MISIRILLFLIPILTLIIFMVWWSQGKRSHKDLSAKEVKYLRYGLIGSIVSLIALGTVLRLTDTSTTDRDAEYVPPHMEDGKLVPGAFKEPDGAGEPAADDKEN